MNWSIEHINYMAKLNRLNLLNERVEIGNRVDFINKVLANVETMSNGKTLFEHLNTQLSSMTKEYRDAYYLLFDKHLPLKDPIEIEGEIYERSIVSIRLIDVVYAYLFKDHPTLDSDGFNLTPYLSYINGTQIIAGFMVFFRDPENDHHINEIGLFSFDPQNKQFGKQVWEDFDECIIDYLGRGYTLEWIAFKNNRACKHYDELVKNFNGIRTEDDIHYKYKLGIKNESTFS